MAVLITHDVCNILQISDKQQLGILVLLMYNVFHITVHRQITIVSTQTFGSSSVGL